MKKKEAPKVLRRPLNDAANADIKNESAVGYPSIIFQHGYYYMLVAVESALTDGVAKGVYNRVDGMNWTAFRNDLRAAAAWHKDFCIRQREQRRQLLREHEAHQKKLEEIQQRAKMRKLEDAK